MIHDPAIFYDEVSGNYYTYSTGAICQKSKDLVHWQEIGKVVERPPQESVEWTGSEDIWAPDIVKVGKEYRQAGHRMHQPARRRGDQRRGYRHAAEGSIAYKVNWEPGAARCAPGSHAVLTSEAAYLTYHLRGFWPAPPHTRPLFHFPRAILSLLHH